MMSKDNDKQLSDQSYIPLEKFAKMVGKNETTILRRRNEIPGIKNDGGSWVVLKGTRYPFKINSCKIEDDDDKRRVLLLAISKYRYIDAEMLGIWQETFEGYLDDFLRAGLIHKTNVPNQHGANAYDCTEKGSTIIKKRKDSFKQQLANAIAECVGTFAGAAYSQVIQTVDCPN